MCGMTEDTMKISSSELVDTSTAMDADRKSAVYGQSLNFSISRLLSVNNNNNNNNNEEEEETILKVKSKRQRHSSSESEIDMRNSQSERESEDEIIEDEEERKSSDGEMRDHHERIRSDRQSSASPYSPNNNNNNNNNNMNNHNGLQAHLLNSMGAAAAANGIVGLDFHSNNNNSGSNNNSNNGSAPNPFPMFGYSSIFLPNYPCPFTSPASNNVIRVPAHRPLANFPLLGQHNFSHGNPLDLNAAPLFSNFDPRSSLLLKDRLTGLLQLVFYRKITI